ncbi:hypothetical protein [Streptomyces deccanensis]|uniref:hypothetical protein n=1 Tax=Streptomyces deccanensis TaxID=424188 RepID=UPI001EFA48BB|nr:hypothetical protein [Streptomyces deccanensis]ULR53176.1 hypothetical protein L3078_30035 [Streptomyces deccanensis]
MRATRAASLLIVSTLAAGVLGGAGPAAAHGHGPFGKPCEPGYEYVATSTKKSVKAQGRGIQKGIGVTLANYNGGSKTMTSVFTSETEGEVGISVSGKLKAKSSVVLAEVEHEYGVEVSAKLRVKIGNQIRVKTPPKKTSYARYGVFRLKVTGYSRYINANCTKGTKIKSTILTPHLVGWYTYNR